MIYPRFDISVLMSNLSSTAPKPATNVFRNVTELRLLLKQKRKLIGLVERSGSLPAPNHLSEELMRVDEGIQLATISRLVTNPLIMLSGRRNSAESQRRPFKSNYLGQFMIVTYFDVYNLNVT